MGLSKLNWIRICRDRLYIGNFYLGCPLVAWCKQGFCVEGRRYYLSARPGLSVVLVTLLATYLSILLVEAFAIAEYYYTALDNYCRDT